MTTFTLDANAQATIVLSDVHIGDNSPTCWYQPSVHEGYLETLLGWVIQNRAAIKELVILGDLFDFWTYTPATHPPGVDAIVRANPGILGPSGLIARVLDALGGRVKYLIGNHDMTVTQADLNLVGDPQGPHIMLVDERYYVDRDLNVQYTHGHYTTLFNAPDEFNGQFGGLPLGHFVTRAVAYMVDQQLKTMPPGTTAADLPGQGSSYDVNFAAFFNAIPAFISDPSMARAFIEYVIGYTKIPRDTQVVLADGQSVEIGHVGDIYANLWTQWENRYGLLYTYKAAMADYDGSYMGWFSTMEAFRNGVWATIKGHTHVPKLGLPIGMDVSTMNTGFECPALPDLTRGEDPLAFSFGIVTSGQQMRVAQVTKSSDRYAIQSLSVPQDWIISPSAAGDFSSYITLNCSPEFNAVRLDMQASHGTYVVEPPLTLSGGTTRFWLQDLPGVMGTEGSVRYRVTSGPNTGQIMTLTFSCPTGFFPNSCGGATFCTKSGTQTDYGTSGHVEKWGHPFFVQFQL